jgi:AhpD family alkylhydroperoxidase
VIDPTALDLLTKEIVVLRVSARNGCRYCVDTHTVAAWDAGLSQAETRRCAVRPRASSGAEQALIAFGDVLCDAPAPHDVADGLRSHFAEHEIDGLSLLAEATAMLNRFCTMLELPTTPATRARLDAAA